MTTTTATPAGPLSEDELQLIDAYWRAANYLSVGQIYLLDNPLLREPLTPDHIKPRLLGHWGTTPGLNLIYAHMNRVIRNWDLDAIYVTGPGHGGPGLVANAYLEGTYTERYSTITRDEEGLRRLFRQFSFPGGIPSHVAPETPGSIHEGGELGYSLAHAYGAAFDNPDLVVCCVIGDGEAETGPLAASWHANKFVDPARDGAVLPILHLNGYKIANPTVLARIPDEELVALLSATATACTSSPATTRPRCTSSWPRRSTPSSTRSRRIQKAARAGEPGIGPRPSALADDRAAHAEGLDRTQGRGRPPGRGHLPRTPGSADPGARPTRSTSPCWSRGCAATAPRSCSTRAGALAEPLAALPPKGHRRMSANPHANGGELLVDLRLPDFRDYAVAGREARHHVQRGDPGAGHLPARRDPRQPRLVPPLRSRRDRVQPALRRSSRRRSGPGTRS